MRSITFPDAFARNFIGFEPLLRFSETISETSFPPHNIVRLSENDYRLTLALAGFAKEDVTISLQSGVLTISGSKPLPETEPDYLYHGIAFRDFSRAFKIGENVEIVGASLENGLLEIDLARHVPEEQKPKLIQIK